MTRPRRHLAGQVVALSRRCSNRCCFTRPDGTMNAIAAYAFACAAQSYGIDIHAIMVMSNHVHLIVTDVRGRRSDFMRDAMSAIAKARNADLNRSESLWNASSYGATLLLDRDAEERSVVYTLLNPVAAGLVERVEQWPGYMIRPCDWGKTIKVPKPDVYFGHKTPEFAAFKPKRPPGFDDMSLDEVRAHFEALLKEGEERLRRERKREKKRVLGVKRVLATNPFSSPSKPAPRGEISPRFASKNAALLIAAIAQHRAFLTAYDQERERWLKGKKRVEFPCGTVWLRRNSPVKCRDPQAPEAGMASMMTLKPPIQCRVPQAPGVGVALMGSVAR